MTSEGHLNNFASFGTNAIHTGQDPRDNASFAVVPPISMSSTFMQTEPGIPDKGYDYSRGGNPTRNALESAFAAISNGKHGFAWSSGLAGTTAILQLLEAGDHVVAMHDLYGGTNRLFRRVGVKMGLKFDFVDATDASKVERAIRPETKLVWIESPTNPLLQVCDIRAIAAVVAKRKRTQKIMMVVDNTFMSSYFQRPLELGADIEFASVTKYLNGHSDLVMGMCTTRDDEIAKELRFVQMAVGMVPSPFDCWLCNRGLKTLHVRMRAHQENAWAVANYLEQSPKVSQVIYPGLKSHPQHELAKSQGTGFSGMVTFRIKGGMAESRRFLKATKVFTLAESLGAVESLAELPAIMTHASVPAADRVKLGITDSLIRLSVGIEDCMDLLQDLRQALDAAVSGPAGPDPATVMASIEQPAAVKGIKERITGIRPTAAPAQAQATNGGYAAAPSTRSTASETTATTTATASTTTSSKPVHITHPSARFEPPTHNNGSQQQQQTVTSPSRARQPSGSMAHPASRFEPHVEVAATPTRTTVTTTSTRSSPSKPVHIAHPGTRFEPAVEQPTVSQQTYTSTSPTKDRQAPGSMAHPASRFEPPTAANGDEDVSVVGSASPKRSSQAAVGKTNPAPRGSMPHPAARFESTANTRTSVRVQQAPGGNSAVYFG